MGYEAGGGIQFFVLVYSGPGKATKYFNSLCFIINAVFKLEIEHI